MNPYEVLGLEPGAEPHQIKAAYRRRAQQFHPDRHGGDEATFHAIQLAYEMLSDPSKREALETLKPDDAEDLDHAENMLRLVFTAALDGHFDDGDAITASRDHLAATRRDVIRHIQEAGKKIVDTRKRLNRLSCTSPSNLYEEIAIKRIAEAEAEITHYEQEKRRITIALKMLDSYSDVTPGRRQHRTRHSTSYTTNFRPYR